MHNLEDRISQWRAECLASEELQREVVDELEDHLRQKLDELRASNLSDEDKFVLATVHLGQPVILGNEFEKLNARSIRLKQIGYMIAGYLLIDTLIKLIHVAAKVTSGIGLSIENVAPFAPAIYIITGTLLFLALFYNLWKAMQSDSTMQSTTLFQKLRAVQRQYPRRTLGVIAVGFTALTLINRMGFNIVLARVVSMQEFGNFMMSSAIYDIGTGLLVPLLLSAFLLWSIRADSKSKMFNPSQ